jgi:hypothetical protein
MARYKHIDTSPRLIPVDLERQLLPGTFEYALNYLVDHELDLSGFDARYKNDLTGATAYQIIVEAQAHGTGSEQSLLMPVVEATSPLCTPDTLITADAGYHSEANLKALAAQDRPALIADNQMRKRDERFKDQAKYKAQPDPLYDKAHPKKSAGHYRPKRTSPTIPRPALAFEAGRKAAAAAVCGSVRSESRRGRSGD